MYRYPLPATRRSFLQYSHSFPGECHKSGGIYLIIRLVHHGICYIRHPLQTSRAESNTTCADSAPPFPRCSTHSISDNSIITRRSRHRNIPPEVYCSKRVKTPFGQWACYSDVETNVVHSEGEAVIASREGLYATPLCSEGVPRLLTVLDAWAGARTEQPSLWFCPASPLAPRFCCCSFCWNPKWKRNRRWPC